MFLTDIEVVIVCSRVLAGDSWAEIAREMGTSHQRLRRCVADNLKLHVPKRKKS